MNSQISSKTMPEGGKAYSRKETAEEKQEAKVQSILRKRQGTMAEKVAGSQLHHVNYYWPGAKEAFQFKPHLQTVDFYFPQAKGGALYVDMPKQKWQMEAAEQKRPEFKKRGLRYVVIQPEMSEYDVLKQLDFKAGE